MKKAEQIAARIARGLADTDHGHAAEIVGALELALFYAVRT